MSAFRASSICWHLPHANGTLPVPEVRSIMKASVVLSCFVLLCYCSSRFDVLFFYNLGLLLEVLSRFMPPLPIIIFVGAIYRTHDLVISIEGLHYQVRLFFLLLSCIMLIGHLCSIYCSHVWIQIKLTWNPYGCNVVLLAIRPFGIWCEMLLLWHSEPICLQFCGSLLGLHDPSKTTCL